MLEINFKTTLVILLWFLPLVAKAQDTCVWLHLIPKTADFATADHLSNTYLIQGFELEKYDSTGRLVTRYSNNRLGTPAFLDVSNPLKIMAWYADFQTAVFLDRNLTELGSVNLNQAGYPAVRCLASSADGNLWAYDEATSYLLKLSTAGEKLLESQPLNLEFAQRFAPTCIRDDGGQAVFLSDPLQGVAIFDPFAQMNKVLLIKGLTQFEVENGQLIYTKNNRIQMENWRGLSVRQIPFPTPSPGAAMIGFSRNRLFWKTLSGVEVYQF